MLLYSVICISYRSIKRKYTILSVVKTRLLSFSAESRKRKRGQILQCNIPISVYVRIDFLLGGKINRLSILLLSFSLSLINIPFKLTLTAKGILRFQFEEHAVNVNASQIRRTIRI